MAYQRFFKAYAGTPIDYYACTTHVLMSRTCYDDVYKRFEKVTPRAVMYSTLMIPPYDTTTVEYLKNVTMLRSAIKSYGL